MSIFKSCTNSTGITEQCWITPIGNISTMDIVYPIAFIMFVLIILSYRLEDWKEVLK